MEQFSEFTFIKQIELDDFRDKFNMGYRISCLLEEEISLKKYGAAVQHIFLSPLIGEVFTPISTYVPSEKKLKVQYLMDTSQAVGSSEAHFFRLMIEGLINEIGTMNLPQDFDFTAFQEDVLQLRFEQLPVVV